MADREIDPVSRKTSEEALAFVRKVQKAFPKTPRSKEDRVAVQNYLAQFNDEELRAVGSRILSDLMQRPPRTIKEGDLPPVPRPRPESRGAIPTPSRPNVGAETKKRTKRRAGPARKRAGAQPRSARRRARRA